MSKASLTIGGIPVSVDPINGIIVFTAAMTMDGDGGRFTYAPDGRGRDDLANAKTRDGHWCGVVTVNGVPYLRPDGFYVSTTSCQRPGKAVCDPERYLDSEQVPFIAVPPELIMAVPQTVIGSRVMVRNLKNKKWCVAAVGDVGPRGHLGEGSEALAKALGLDPSPRDGGTDAAIIQYEIHAGVPFNFNGETLELQPLR